MSISNLFNDNSFDLKCSDIEVSTLTERSGQYSVVLKASTLSANRVIELPDASITLGNGTSYNQSLNTTDDVVFNSLEAPTLKLASGLFDASLTLIAPLAGDTALTLPITGGQIALTSDIPTAPNQALNTNSDVLFNSVDVTTEYKLGGDKLISYGGNNNNIYVGRDSGFTSGINSERNTALGTNSLLNLQDLITATDNTAIGFEACTSLTDGANNVVIGKSACDAMSSGSSNICIGAGAGSAYSTGSNGNILIGNVGVNGESSITRIGTNQTDCHISGNLKIPGTINSTITNGNIILAPNGTGTVECNSELTCNEKLSIRDTSVQTRQVQISYDTVLDRGVIISVNQGLGPFKDTQIGMDPIQNCYFTNDIILDGDSIFLASNTNNTNHYELRGLTAVPASSKTSYIPARTGIIAQIDAIPVPMVCSVLPTVVNPGVSEVVYGTLAYNGFNNVGIQPTANFGVCLVFAVITGTLDMYARLYDETNNISLSSTFSMSLTLAAPTVINVITAPAARSLISLRCYSASGTGNFTIHGCALYL